MSQKSIGINNRTKVFCLIFIFFFSVKNKAYPNLDFETKVGQIRSELSDIFYFEADDSKFYKPNFDNFEVVNFTINCQPLKDQIS